MSFLHKELWLNNNQAVQVRSSHQCNLYLLTDSDFNNYKRGNGFKYYGGFFTQFPARIVPSHSGRWHLVLDLAGGSATIQHSINIVNI